MKAATTLGFVLTGGKSSRMGRDKSLLLWRGRTLLEHVAETVRAAAGEVILVGPPERYAKFGYRVVPDAAANCGPLAGIAAALACTSADWNLVAACDMPALDSAFLRNLLARAAVGEYDCLMPVGPDGRAEPLCAVYHRRCLKAVQQALDRGILKLTDAVAGLRVGTLPVTDAALFRNLNTPQDWGAFLDA